MVELLGRTGPVSLHFPFSYINLGFERRFSPVRSLPPQAYFLGSPRVYFRSAELEHLWRVPSVEGVIKLFAVARLVPFHMNVRVDTLLCSLLALFGVRRVAVSRRFGVGILLGKAE